MKIMVSALVAEYHGFSCSRSSQVLPVLDGWSVAGWLAGVHPPHCHAVGGIEELFFDCVHPRLGLPRTVQPQSTALPAPITTSLTHPLRKHIQPDAYPLLKRERSA